MGDLASSVCHYCGRAHPELEDCDYYTHLPVDSGWEAQRPWEARGQEPLPNLCAEIYLGETIVAAAIRIPTPDEWRQEMWRGRRAYPDYLTIAAEPPARHGTLMHPISEKYRVGPNDQGFLTSTGRYVDRREAKKIAIASGQPRIADNPTWDQLDELYSEDLW